LITLSQSSKFSPEIATTTAIIAGGATNRSVTAWKQLEADIRAGKVTKLVCWKLDRLGRTACELLALRDELLQRKVDLICVMSGMMGLDSPEGRMMFSALHHSQSMKEKSDVRGKPLGSQPQKSVEFIKAVRLEHGRQNHNVHSNVDVHFDDSYAQREAARRLYSRVGVRAN
jgi:hypothetical protein